MQVTLKPSVINFKSAADVSVGVITKKEPDSDVNTANEVEKTLLDAYITGIQPTSRDLFKARLDEVAKLYGRCEDLYNMDEAELADNSLCKQVTERMDDNGNRMELCTKISDLKFDDNGSMCTNDLMKYHLEHDLRIFTSPRDNKINSITRCKPGFKKDVFYPASNSADVIGAYAKNLREIKHKPVSEHVIDYTVTYAADDVVLFDKDNQPIGFIKGYNTDYDTYDKKTLKKNAEMLYSVKDGKLTLLSKNSKEYEELIQIAPNVMDLHKAIADNEFFQTKSF